MDKNNLKFRAWVPDLNFMGDVTELSWQRGMWFAGIPYEDAFDGMVWRSLRECEILQYTGLKDVNGEEIYEGDILKVTTVEKGTEVLVAQVVFSNFQWVLRHNDEVFEMRLLTDISSFKGNIIGNIYENGDLLEEKDV